MPNNNPKNRINQLMNSHKFIIFMNVLRIVLVVWAIGMTIYLIKEIDAVKLLAYDPCKICMAKTGCDCFCTSLG